MSITIAYTDGYLRWTGSHASPRRAKLATEHIEQRAHDENVDVDIIAPSLKRTVRKDGTTLIDDMKKVHALHYVDDLLAGKIAEHPDEQGQVAALMFEGTRVLVDRMEQDKFVSGNVYFNPQGAKHHAGYDYSSGFCALNDMAWAAHHFAAQGKRVAYLDWDAHHGDGVEFLTADNPNILTASIHQQGIFPGTGNDNDRAKNVYNYPMTKMDGSDMFDAVTYAVEVIDDFKPDVVLMAIGADGHREDPLTGLRWDVEDFVSSASYVGGYLRKWGISPLIGGAGGYTPFTYTPIVWAETIRALHKAMHTPSSWWG